jgi:hypothetical protein
MGSVFIGGYANKAYSVSPKQNANLKGCIHMLAVQFSYTDGDVYGSVIGFDDESSLVEQQTAVKCQNICKL